MSTRAHLQAHTVLSLICTASLVAVGCSSDRNTGGTKVRPPVRDAGPAATRDAGPGGGTRDGGTGGGGCAANPNNCAPRELIGAPPSCTCLNVCETGFIWNAATSMCDPVQGGRDGGSGADGGGMATCANDTDCQMADPNGVCLNVDGMNPPSRCAGQATCGCFVQCDPFNPMGNVCAGAGGVCSWLGTMGVVPGVCQQDPGGGTQAQMCQTMYDLGGMRQGDSCNGAANYFCWGTTPDTPNNGQCASFCDDTAVPGWCESLGMDYYCDPVGPVDGIGLCLLNPPNFNDLGTACMAGGTCQSGFCSQVLAGSCSASCGGLNNCPANSVCLNAGDPAQGGEGLICVPNCTFGDDTTCTTGNPQLVCERFPQMDGSNIDVCIPN